MPGHWIALIAGDSTSRNQTGIGAAMYDDKGKLVGFRWAGPERAIQRGDLPDNDFMRSLEPAPPETVGGMARRLESFGNAMSSVRWEALLPTLDWSEECLDELFKGVTGDHA